ncbi:WD40 repeat domain-containing protein [Planctomyces sp. SH-PL62]|uniref:WD40 repeat domain-containing protein n=1 Tax=Planctomyces sp. SH-PL62 TaxID=1636152 RepID=UPI00078EA2A1|nr:WD40 repeat domain-containing protein [Planctomyces sp. SH-PL62]AMV35831.1 translocation protein TolB [Planctomyces sp. SH-PL62]
MTLSMDTKPMRGGLAKHSDVVTSVAFSPDGRSLVSGGWDGLVKIWELREGEAAPKLMRAVRGKWDEVEAVAFSPDGRTIAGLGAGWDGLPFGAVTLWEADAKRSRRLLRVSGKLDAMAFSPDGLTLATSGGEDRTVTLWNVSDGAERVSLPEHAAPVWSVAYSPDGRLLAAGSGVVPAMADPAAEDRRGEVKLWDVTSPTPTCAHRLVGHDYGVAATTFSPIAPLLATGGFDRMIRLWDVERGVCLNDFAGHAGWVAALAFSPTEPLLASGSHDRTIRLWDLETGRCRTVLEGHAGNVYSVAFSPDGRTLASGSLDGSVRLWAVPDAQED